MASGTWIIVESQRLNNPCDYCNNIFGVDLVKYRTCPIFLAKNWYFVTISTQDKKHNACFGPPLPVRRFHQHNSFNFTVNLRSSSRPPKNCRFECNSVSFLLLDTMCWQHLTNLTTTSHFVNNDCLKGLRHGLPILKSLDWIFQVRRS